MKQQVVLLTNDDGPRSPTLVPLADALSREQASIRIAIPDRERSWVSQAVTRFEPLTATSRKFGEHPGYTTTGTPADCASLGIFNLYESKPDLLVSGMNMGVNAGLPFYLSSGTVGAAISGFLCGVRSFASSIYLPNDVYRIWVEHNTTALLALDAYFQRAAEATVRVIKAVEESEALRNADLISINLPWEVNETTPWVQSALQRGYYGPLFRTQEDGSFRHQMSDISFEEAGDCALPLDLEVLRAGDISVSAIGYRLTA